MDKGFYTISKHSARKFVRWFALFWNAMTSLVAVKPCNQRNSMKLTRQAEFFWCVFYETVIYDGPSSPLPFVIFKNLARGFCFKTAHHFPVIFRFATKVFGSFFGVLNSYLNRLKCKW